jgi:dTDP-4-dehydrorhamnose reductase
MKALLTGGSGLLGRALVAAFDSRPDMEYIALGFSRAKPPLVKLNLNDHEAIDSLVGEYRPDIIIHTAAERRPDAVEEKREESRNLNVEATGALARAGAKIGAAFIYISTDSVFDGTNPPYYPDCPVNPLNEYARQKLEGERKVAEAYGSDAGRKAAVLRIPLLYGPFETLDECSVSEMAKALKDRTPKRIEHWTIRYPVHVADVAQAILAVSDALQKGNAESLGPASPALYLLSGDTAYTKYEMVVEIANVLGIDSSYLSPDPAPPSGAPRPKDCRLDTSALQRIGFTQKKHFAAEIGALISPLLRG